MTTPSPRVDEDTLYSDFRGQRQPGVEKRQRSLLARLDVLGDVLRGEERVLLVTRALSPTPLFEQIVTGAVFSFVKRCILVFTDERLLHFPATVRFHYRGSIGQIEYADIATMQISNGVLIVDYVSGKRDKFLYVARRERRKLETLLPELPLAAGEPTGRGLLHLCPGCLAPLARGKFTCPDCTMAFKNSRTATLLALLVPGGGYFYARRPRLGLIAALVELLILTALVLSVVEWIRDHDQSFAIVIFALFLAVAKLVTVYHARFFVSEFIPARRDFVRPPGRQK